MTSSEAAAASAAWASFGDAGARLAATLARGRIAPAYLFEGPDLAMPREAARRFAAALVCGAQGPRPCLACNSCRRVASGQHPDVHFQGRDKATVISVEAMSALLERAHTSPLEGARQGFVIEPADALAPEGIGRYLKTLEEPPPSTTFLLVTERPDRLPDTVRSRCQRVRFPPPSESEIAERLARGGLDPARARRVAAVCGASGARAERIASLSLDEQAEVLLAASRAPVPSAATAADEVLAALRARIAGAGADDEGRTPDAASQGADAGATAPGEALRRAMDDLFHVLLSLARDRAAGRPAAGVEALSPAEACDALPVLARLAALVRANVSPPALLIETVSSLRGARRGGAARGRPT